VGIWQLVLEGDRQGFPVEFQIDHPILILSHYITPALCAHLHLRAGDITQPGMNIQALFKRD
jgi:hypothetical protein